MEEFSDKVQELEKIMEQTVSRMAVAEAERPLLSSKQEPLKCEQTKPKTHSSASRRQFALEIWR